MTTVKELKNGATLQHPIYVHSPYVILNKDNVVLYAGTLESITDNLFGTYCDDCIVEIREYDLYLNDNTKIDDKKTSQNFGILELGTQVTIDDEKKSQGYIVGYCSYCPSWANEVTQKGYIFESDNYDTVIVVHESNVIGILE